jgi:GNAT superfamily N-acetyltransferase/uncharacterized protein YndB with AHSA1/START domain
MSSRIQVSLRVAASPQRAFEVFTRDIGAWWRPDPLFAFTPKGTGVLSFEPPTHSSDAVRQSGRLIETQANGEVFEIGEVTAWEPGKRLAFGWRQSSFAAGQSTQVEVRFEAVGVETRVTVEHRGWDTVPQDHVARHHFPDRVFLLRHGEWWQALLASLRAASTRGHDVTFRPATPRDAQTIRAIESEAGQRYVSVGLVGIADAPPMSLDFVNRKIAAGEVILAIDAHATSVGFVMYEPEASGMYVQELGVLSAYAGRRIGAALLEEVARLARQGRKTKLTLSTFREVPWNAPYYRRLGFRDLVENELDAAMRARRDAHTARGLDESRRIFMQRDLE